MAKRIDEATIQKIHELYAAYGVMTRVADELGISTTSVSRYLKQSKPENKTKAEITFDKEKVGNADYISNFNSLQDFANFCILSTEEWKQLKDLQKMF